MLLYISVGCYIVKRRIASQLKRHISVWQIRIAPNNNVIRRLSAFVIPFMRRVETEIAILSQSSTINNIIWDWISFIIDGSEITESQRPISRWSF